MILYVEDILREVNILNWYKGEAEKHGDANAVFVQSNAKTQEALMYHLRSAVVDVLKLANANRVKFTCDHKDDMLIFSLSPLREGREHLLALLKEAIRQYLVYEIRRLWMANIRPDWAEGSLVAPLRDDICQVMNDVTTGEMVRRRYRWI